MFSGFLFQSYNPYIGKKPFISGAQKWVVFGPVGDLTQLKNQVEALLISVIYII